MGVSLWMMTGFALDQPSRPVIVSGVVQGLGLGLIFVPLQSLAFETLAPRMRTTAAALLNLSRNIGGSIGISVVSAQLVRMTQVAHADIASTITEQTIPTMDPTILQTIAPQGAIAIAIINAEVTRQAVFIAYLDDFKLMMLVTFAVLPLLLLMSRGQQRKVTSPDGDGLTAARRTGLEVRRRWCQTSLRISGEQGKNDRRDLAGSHGRRGRFECARRRQPGVGTDRGRRRAVGP